ncbi:MAG: hypothetical protein P0Y66_13950 [Candidatus Kaistia colombiensis]|nr:MAG: hypothetical protein P0Y66_13950 [Kaistia sp.]
MTLQEFLTAMSQVEIPTVGEPREVTPDNFDAFKEGVIFAAAVLDRVNRTHVRGHAVEGLTGGQDQRSAADVVGALSQCREAFTGALNSVCNSFEERTKGGGSVR